MNNLYPSIRYSFFFNKQSSASRLVLLNKKVHRDYGYEIYKENVVSGYLNLSEPCVMLGVKIINLLINSICSVPRQ